ncbi:hypothetical protein BPAE_0106g00080 [Botrytis paeoniae]|uniref:Uncharacterized protein n=1 Tax=Botrytis paeoniae TaxID=278948 RepID=A0A4Z1FI39_9HELO|nr:hypothetical protein BPAE_0106g00080 [Botrytis paeoniae]
MRGTWVVAGPALFAARKTLVFRRSFSMSLVLKTPFENPVGAGLYGSLWILEWRFESWEPITHIILINAAQLEEEGHHNGYEQPRRATPQYSIHPAHQPISDHDQLDPAYVRVSHYSPHSQQQQVSGPKGTKVQQTDAEINLTWKAILPRTLSTFYKSAASGGLLPHKQKIIDTALAQGLISKLRVGGSRGGALDFPEHRVDRHDEGVGVQGYG